jgi:hypothetical protein
MLTFQSLSRYCIWSYHERCDGVVHREKFGQEVTVYFVLSLLTRHPRKTAAYAAFHAEDIAIDRDESDDQERRHPGQKYQTNDLRNHETTGRRRIPPRRNSHSLFRQAQ